MSEHNPQVERNLEVLTEICREALNGDHTGIESRTDAILKALLMSGYARNAETTLQAELESRVKGQPGEGPTRHAEKLVAIAGEIQTKFNKLKLWESTQPEKHVPAKAANFSAATDS